MCACNDGYDGSGDTCTGIFHLLSTTYLCSNQFADIDECVANTDGCSPTANCTNTDGSYTCTCWGGYSGDGFACTGISLKIKK